MFPVHCSQCSRKSFSAGIPRCFHCGYVEPSSDAGGNSNPTEPEAPKKYGTSSGSKTHIHQQDTHMKGVVLTNDRNIYQSCDRKITDNTEDHNRCRNEIDKIQGHILKTDSEENGMNNDLPSTNEIEVYVVMQDQGNLNKTKQQSSSSNLGNFQNTQNENPRLNIPNLGASRTESIHSMDHFHAIPGPSRFHDSKSTSNSSEEEFQSRASLTMQPASETLGTTSLCGICRREMDKHCLKDQGKILYKCCGCQNVFTRTCDLQKHASIHRPQFLLCNICGELIFDNDAHGREKPCKVCHERFQCRTQLEEHTLVHSDYYDTNCRACGTNIDGHFDYVKNVYKCCHCHFSSTRRRYLRGHLHKHTGLKVFKCGVCGRRFTLNSSLHWHLSSHFKCKTCGKSFTNKEHLEMHLKEQHTQP